MNRIRMTIVAFALVACSSAAGAVERPSSRIRRDAPKGITEAFYSCIDKARFNEIDEAYCTTQERERQDHRLNASYRALLHKLDGDKRKSAIEAERAWLKLQGKTAELEGSLYGSELIGNLQVTQNETFAICQRANQLDEYLALASDL
ncbi:MAG TPA: lysozyme inhibitor LprI family protein [Frateuria sp.]|uniref:lysozyme inhibitor LprI family protein n=1 Tax=Frateuria sp. TaxID=2211372 RepID=UPI002D7E3452|nr:lysozyme inhibitor LprI family protein [Frateuria sp.]HET6807138.1 lysozyme inhibitor LprI family protein [Frateuria sp.]